MNKIAAFVGTLVVMAHIGASHGKEPAASAAMPSDIAAAIDRAVRLLEEKNYEEFFKNCVHPDDLNKILKERTLAELIKSFAENKAQGVVEALKTARTLAPKMSQGDTRATFDLCSANSGRKGPCSLVFDKHEGRWLMRN